MARHDFCSSCGTAFPEPSGMQRLCCHCGQTTYLNPLPVAAVLLPVDDGVLAVRRAIDPKIGELTFPGGFVMADESWQAGAARELYEETGIQIVDPRELEVFDVLSTSRGHLINIFGLARPRRLQELPAPRANHEVSETVILYEPCAMAFEQDAIVLRKFFAWRDSQR